MSRKIDRPSPFTRIEGFINGISWFGGQAEGKVAFVFITQKVTEGTGDYKREHYNKFTVKVHGADAHFLQGLLTWSKEAPEGEQRNTFVSIKGRWMTYEKPTGNTYVGTDGKTYDQTESVPFFNGFDSAQVDPSSRLVQYDVKDFIRNNSNNQPPAQQSA